MNVGAKVAAIIPTIGRPELSRAVRSVVAQTTDVLPIVVLDRPQMRAQIEEQLREYPHQLVVTRGALGGGAARNLGVQASDQKFIAYLDDDDEWAPDKTERQLAMLEDQPLRTVASSRALLISGSESRTLPEIIYRNESSIADYLLDRSTLKLRRRFMQSSTLLMSRELALQIPWNEQLKRHQDWDLLIALRRSSAKILMHEEALVKVHQGSSQSISKSTDWKASEDWIDSLSVKVSSRARADFLASVALRAAIASRDRRQSMRLLRKSLASFPHISALLVGVSECLRK